MIGYRVTQVGMVFIEQVNINEVFNGHNTHKWAWNK